MTGGLRGQDDMTPRQVAGMLPRSEEVLVRPRARLRSRVGRRGGAGRRADRARVHRRAGRRRGCGARGDGRAAHRARTSGARATGARHPLAHGHRRPARPPPAGEGERPPRPQRQRAGDLLPAGGRRSAPRWDPDAGRARSARRSAARRARSSVDVVLGPGVNIKRSPLCGRNFEYFSEDPLPRRRARRGRWCTGVQGAGRRHVAQALRREQPGDRPDARRAPTSTSARCARSTCRPSSGSSPAAQPWTVMCAYNRSTASTRPSTAGCSPRCCATSGASTASSSPTGAPSTTASPALAAGLDLEMPRHRRRSARRRSSTPSAAGELDEAVARPRRRAGC